jgi:predicted nucleotidyltransferase
MAMTLDELVKQLQAAYRAQLACVVLYGSAATTDHIKGKSDYNVLVLLDRIDAGTLAAASAVARAWREAGNPPPMTMTVDEWRRSADVFPMEYADILERHRVLAGAAPFDGITVSRDHLRLQLEQQVMGKLLQLRQGTLLAGTDGKRQLELISASLSTIMVLFRAVLRLKGEQPPADNSAIAERVGTLGGFDAGPFTRAVRHQRGTQKIDSAEAGALLSQYLSGVERLDAYLDTFPTQERPL